jgi:hypothetical protein
MLAVRILGLIGGQKWDVVAVDKQDLHRILTTIARANRMRFGSGLYFFGGGIPVPSIPSRSFNVPGIPSQTGVTNRPVDLTAKIINGRFSR